MLPLLVCIVFFLDFQNVFGNERFPLPKPEQFDNTKWKLVQGDILVPRNESQTRFVLEDDRWRWKYGRLPYAIQEKDFSEEVLGMIRKGLEELERGTNGCIRPEPKTDKDDSWVRIKGDEYGCFANGLGWFRGERIINLSEGCHRVGVVLHELGHVLGFNHENMRPDRDDYIQVHWENIPKENWHHLDIPDHMTTLDLPYDVFSVMHAEWWMMSNVPNKPAFTPKDKNLIWEDLAKYVEIGTLSPMDKKKFIKAHDLDWYPEVPACNEW